MSAVRDRLTACFQAVFPQIPGAEVATAAADTVADWDSSHHFLLMHVIEEEFSIRIPEDVIGEIDSFAGFESYLRDRVENPKDDARAH